MDTTARVQGGTDGASVLALGMDRGAEASLLARLTSSCGAPGAVSLTEDFDRCTALVVREDSAMLRVAQKTAKARPQLLFLIADAHGRLRDGRGGDGGEIDDASLRELVLGTRDGLRRTLATWVGCEAPLAQQLHDRVSAASGCAALMQGQVPRLLIDFDRRLAVPVDGAGDADPVRLASAFPQLRLEPVTAQQFQAAFADGQALPITPLLWDLAQRDTGISPLLPPLGAGSVVSLRQWPDFRALAHRHDHFRLCCLLLKRASTPAEAADLLSLDRDGVDRFFSAAYLSGYADIRETRGAPKAAVEGAAGRPARGSALARMWRSVRQGLQAVTS